MLGLLIALSVKAQVAEGPLRTFNPSKWVYKDTTNHMGYTPTNYPPKLPLTPEQKRRKEAERLITKALKRSWRDKVINFLKNLL